jgi:hypothetical protein
MSNRSMEETLDALGDLLDDFDQIARAAHARYRAYAPADLIELSSRAQAACTYDHMVAEADRRFLGRAGVRLIESKTLKLWLFEVADVVVRFKKMDEDGRTRNYPTRHAKDFDRGFDLPNLPMPPIRLSAGYLLDKTGTTLERTQISRPLDTKRTMWCAAVVPLEKRIVGERVWFDVTRQGAL